MNIPDEAVEAAAKAILDTPADYPGDEEAQRWAEYIAAAAIEAAAPLIAAEALCGVFSLIRDLTDPEECWYDHHGGCQAHGYLSLQPGEPCPHAEAKQWLINNATTEGL